MAQFQEISENDLVLGCKKQDMAMQKALYLQYGPMLMGVCARYLKPRENAEEVFHDVVLKIYDKIDKYSGTGSLKAWCRRLAVNTCLDYIRKHKNHIRLNYLEEQLVEIEDKIEDEALLENAKLNELVKLIDTLPQQQQIVLNLFVMDGFSHREVANRLSISEGASRSLLQRAKRKLKEEMTRREKVKKQNEK